MKKYTKIVATLGPALGSIELLEKTILQGVDICRLNLSHGSHEVHAESIRQIRVIRDKLTLSHGRASVGILIDLQGPKLRIGDIANPRNGIIEPFIYLENNQDIIFTTALCLGTKEKVFIDYPAFCEDVKVGEHILVDDGKILFEVIDIQKNNSSAGGEVHARVLHGGILQPRKGVNLPNTKISLNCLTAKDLLDLDFAIAQKVEWIGLSFVRKASDILEIKEIIARQNGSAKVIAKIEKPEALEDLEAIIQVADAVMVARGDLGIEIPLEKVPLVQKDIIQRCRKYAKPVIIATQMMESMIEHISPTRAEVNDVANAVLDGADALMLSGETSVGKHPDKVVQIMSKIIQEIEEKGNIFYTSPLLHPLDQKNLLKIQEERLVSDSICHSAIHLAEHLNCTAITTITSSGYTPLVLASYRPKTKIIVFTTNRVLLHQLSLVWGVETIYYNKLLSTDETIEDMLSILKEKSYIQKDNFVIHLSTIPREKMGKTNMLKLTRVE